MSMIALLFRAAPATAPALKTVAGWLKKRPPMAWYSGRGVHFASGSEWGKQCPFPGSTAIGRDGQIVEGPWRDVKVVDRLGGDAFAGGFLAVYIADPDDLSRALALASAAQALKHTMPGDFLCATRGEIEAAVASDEGGVLQR